MDELEELLPGIEHYLTRVLSAEKLSAFAEERRLYFVERLDILKLPASCPPRPEVRRSTPEPLEEEDGEGDFAAYQRELSRLTHSNSRALIDDSDTEKNTVKVYDDIDLGLDNGDAGDDGEEEDPELNLYEIPVCQQQLLPPAPGPTAPLSEDSASPLGAGNGGSLATVASIEELPKDSPDSPPPRPPSLPPPLPSTMPPPLPPRRDRVPERNSGSGSAVPPGPPDLPARPGSLARRSEVYGSEKSDRSEDHSYDLTDGEDTNYEHCTDDEDHYNEVKLPKKPDVKLPKREKKRKERRLTQKIKSRVTAMWESGTPYSSLEEVTLSGELYLRSKLSWARRLAALSQGSFICYKPEKLQRPMVMIHLEGYSATWCEKDSKRGFEIRLDSTEAEDHVFSVDFKEWAVLWCEYMNAMAKGLPPPGPHQHLARTFPGNKGSHEELCSSKMSLASHLEESVEPDLVPMEPVQAPPRSPPLGVSGGKSSTTLAKWDWKTLFYAWAFPLEQILFTFTRGDVHSSNSNLSMNSDGASEENKKPRLRGNKVMRMGSFAYRATQFFENISRKSSSGSGKKRLTQSLSGTGDSNDGITEENSVSSTGNITLAPTSDTSSPVFDDSPAPSPLQLERPPEPPPSDVRIEGDLVIFSSFNKRRWGTRWCLVRGQVFECYRNKESSKCELNFDLSSCTLRHAVKETKCELALMILENNREKITIEPLTEESLCGWVRVLMSATAMQEVPAGLETYVAPDPDEAAERPEDLAYSTVNKWGPRSPLCDKSPDSGVNSVASPLSAESKPLPSEDQGETVEDAPVGDLYSEVLKKKPSKPLQFQQLAPQVPSSSGDAGTFSAESGTSSEQKNTTDSGFYSVRENNSDSDSGCDDVDARDTSNGLTVVQEISDGCCEDFDSAHTSEGPSKGDVCGNFPSVSAETVSNTLEASESHCEKNSVVSGTDEGASIPRISESGLQEMPSGCGSCSGEVKPSDPNLPEGSHMCYYETQQVCASSMESSDDPENEYDVVETMDDSQFSNTNSLDPSSGGGVTPNISGEEGSEEQGSRSFLSSKDTTLTSQERLAAINKFEDMCDEITEKCSVGSMGLSIQERINRLREKLVEIKRKRIAVRDKRQRAMSTGEAERCDAEYQVLEEECHATDAEISLLEQQLQNKTSITQSTVLPPKD